MNDNSLGSSGNSNTLHNSINNNNTSTSSINTINSSGGGGLTSSVGSQYQQNAYGTHNNHHLGNNSINNTDSFGFGSEFLKNPNIFKRVYDEFKPVQKTNTTPTRNKKLPLSKQLAQPIILNILDGSAKPQVVCGAQLSVWHDTAGPAIEQYWTTKNENSENITQDFLSFISRQTLCGYDISIESEEMRFNIYPDQNMMVPSIIFNCKYHDKITKLSLSIYMDLSKLSVYQHCHDFVSDRLSILASFTLKNFSNNIYDLTSFTKELTTVCTNFEKVFTSSYPPTEISQTFFMDNNVPSPSDIDFIVKAITSHMITYGSTVVIGSKQNEILKWLDTLYLFLTPNERSVSSRQLDSTEVIPDLMIQGLLNANLKEVEEKLPFSLRPTTVIDTDKKEVYQTELLQKYTQYRSDFLINAFILQHKYVRDGKILIQYNNQSIFVKKMITEVFNLPVSYREIYLINYMRFLFRKAAIALYYVQSHGGLNFQKVLKTFMNLSEQDAILLFGLIEKVQLNIFLSAIKPENIEHALADFDAF